MTGDQADLVARLQAVLPRNWFGDTTPVLDGLLSGLATAWQGLYGLLCTVKAQARIATASGEVLDMIAADFFGAGLGRSPGEADTPFRARILREMLRKRGTRQSLVGVLQDLTGLSPIVFEPARSGDTGGYCTGAVGYAVAGAYGSLSLPYQCFVTAYRPVGVGIPLVAGYGSPGPLAYANASWIGAHVTDADILAAIVGVLPAGSIAWTRIV